MKSKLNFINKVAGRYDSRKDLDRYLIKYDTEYIFRGIKKTNVLEIGCSNGIMTEILYRNFKRVVVLEPAGKYFKEIKNKYGNKIEPHKKLVEEFQTNEKFDNIIMARLLEHLTDPVKTLKRVKEWLSPKGFLHIVVPNANSINRLLGWKMGMIKKKTALSDKDILVGHKRVYEMSSLLNHLKKAGLNIVGVEGVYLKPFSNAQMVKLNRKMIRGFYEVGKLVPAELCTELYARCFVKKI